MLFCCFSTVILTALHNCADINCFEMIDLLVLMLFLAVSCIIMMLQVAKTHWLSNHFGLAMS